MRVKVLVTLLLLQLSFLLDKPARVLRRKIRIRIAEERFRCGNEFRIIGANS